MPAQNATPERGLLAHLPAGALIAGTRWYKARFIGGGATGDVYEVYQNPLLPYHRGAMKILTRPRDAAYERRFVREVELLTKLEHRNIVRVFDCGLTADDRAMFVMELLRGPTLGQVLRDTRQRRRVDPFFQHPQLQPDQIWLTVRDICAGLDHAHRQTPAVVHSDIKPDNIVLHRNGAEQRAVLLDFGIANLVGADGERVGTPLYAAPEQLGGLPVTAAADIYSLAVVVYELLTLAHPFEWSSPRPSVAEVCEAHRSRVPIAPRTRMDWIPRSVEETLLRALAKTPGARSADACMFVNELSELNRLGAPHNTDPDDPSRTDPDGVGSSRPLPGSVGYRSPVSTPSGTVVRDWLDAERALAPVVASAVAELVTTSPQPAPPLSIEPPEAPGLAGPAPSPPNPGGAASSVSLAGASGPALAEPRPLAAPLARRRGPRRVRTYVAGSVVSLLGAALVVVMTGQGNARAVAINPQRASARAPDPAPDHPAPPPEFLQLLAQAPTVERPISASPAPEPVASVTTPKVAIRRAQPRPAGSGKGVSNESLSHWLADQPPAPQAHPSGDRLDDIVLR